MQSPVFKDAVFLPQTDKIGYIKTNSEIEALLLEAQMIKKFLPKYNTVWRDGKSHLYVFITKEKFSRVFVGHKTQMSKSKCQIKSKIQMSKIMALAKRNNELFVEGKKEPILLKNLPQETANLILRVRDEAHRFALSYHKKLRSKKLINSA